MNTADQKPENAGTSTTRLSAEERSSLISELALTLDYSYATEHYGVKLLRTVLGVLADETLRMLDGYLTGNLDERRAIVTNVMADCTEEELREVVVYGDAFCLGGDIDAIRRILAGLHKVPELSKTPDLSRFDTEGRKIVRSVCAVQGAVYRNDKDRVRATEPYPMNLHLFKIIMGNPEVSGGVVRLIDASSGLDMVAVAKYASGHFQQHS